MDTFFVVANATFAVIRGIQFFSTHDTYSGIWVIIHLILLVWLSRDST